MLNNNGIIRNHIQNALRKSYIERNRIFKMSDNLRFPAPFYYDPNFLTYSKKLQSSSAFGRYVNSADFLWLRLKILAPLHFHSALIVLRSGQITNVFSIPGLAGHPSKFTPFLPSTKGFIIDFRVLKNPQIEINLWSPLAIP